MENENTPADTTDRGRRIQLLIDEDMANTVGRLANLRRLLDQVNGCLKVELGLPNEIKDVEGE